MPILLDTGILYAYYDRSDNWHKRAVAVIRAEAGGLIVPAPVLPEVDRLVGRRLGPKARAVLYEGFIEGDFLVADLTHDGYRRIGEINRHFASLDLDFVDAAIVVAAETLGISRIATTDRRHFDPLAVALSLTLVP